MKLVHAVGAMPVLVALAITSFTSNARGDGTRGATGAADDRGDVDVRQRLDLLQRRLDGGETAAKRWFWGWAAGFTVVVGVETTLTLARHDRDNRQESALGAISAGLGLVSTLALPPPAAFAPAKIRAMPATTPEQRRRKLDAAQEALETAARKESFGSSWVPHIATAAVSVTSFAIRLLAFRHTTLAFVSIAPSLAVGEGKILTMPTAAMDAQREYQRSITATSRITPATLGWSFTF